MSWRDLTETVAWHHGLKHIAEYSTVSRHFAKVPQAFFKRGDYTQGLRLEDLVLDSLAREEVGDVER